MSYQMVSFYLVSLYFHFQHFKPSQTYVQALLQINKRCCYTLQIALHQGLQKRTLFIIIMQRFHLFKDELMPVHQVNPSFLENVFKLRLFIYFCASSAMQRFPYLVQMASFYIPKRPIDTFNKLTEKVRFMPEVKSSYSYIFYFKNINNNHDHQLFNFFCLLLFYLMNFIKKIFDLSLFELHILSKFYQSNEF